MKVFSYNLDAFFLILLWKKKLKREGDIIEI